MYWEVIFVTFGALLMAVLGWVLKDRPKHEKIIGWAMLIIVMFGFAMGYMVLALTKVLT